MLKRITPIIGAIGLALFATTPVIAQSRYLQCVAYARQVTGVPIRGNANTWWGQAAGRYDRGNSPREGAILAFKSIRGMPAGHVAVVSRIVGDREVLLDHANWTWRGGIEHGARAIDVSEAGDWSEVRVQYGKTGELGTRVNPTFGFIYADTSIEAPASAPVITAKAPRGPLIDSDVIRLAALERASD